MSGQVSVWLVYVTTDSLALGAVSVRDEGGVSGSGFVYLAVPPSVYSMSVFIIFFYSVFRN